MRSPDGELAASNRAAIATRNAIARAAFGGQGPRSTKPARARPHDSEGHIRGARYPASERAGRAGVAEVVRALHARAERTHGRVSRRRQDVSRTDRFGPEGVTNTCLRMARE